MSEVAAVSHGRGGAGNVVPDDTKYVDGNIRKEEDPAQTGGAYSTGRGGGGNIASPMQVPANTGRDGDVVPETAKVPLHEGEGHHSGRGGEGNVVPPPATTSEKPKFDKANIIAKIKEKVIALIKKKLGSSEKGPTTTATPAAK